MYFLVIWLLLNNYYFETEEINQNLYFVIQELMCI